MHCHCNPLSWSSATQHHCNPLSWSSAMQHHCNPLYKAVMQHHCNPFYKAVIQHRCNPLYKAVMLYPSQVPLRSAAAQPPQAAHGDSWGAEALCVPALRLLGQHSWLHEDPLCPSPQGSPVLPGTSGPLQFCQQCHHWPTGLGFASLASVCVCVCVCGCVTQNFH